jgi:hypothetical protein
MKLPREAALEKEIEPPKEMHEKRKTFLSFSFLILTQDSTIKFFSSRGKFGRPYRET